MPEVKTIEPTDNTSRMIVQAYLEWYMRTWAPPTDDFTTFTYTRLPSRGEETLESKSCKYESVNEAVKEAASGGGATLAVGAFVGREFQGELGYSESVVWRP